MKTYGWWERICKLKYNNYYNDINKGNLQKENSAASYKSDRFCNTLKSNNAVINHIGTYIRILSINGTWNFIACVCGACYYTPIILVLVGNYKHYKGKQRSSKGQLETDRQNLNTTAAATQIFPFKQG